MRFLADMGVSLAVRSWLRNEGHDVVHLRDEGLHSLPNGAIFRKAASESRIVLTFDLDFGEIVANAGADAVTVIIFRLKNTRASHVIQRLRTVVQRSAVALQGRVVVLVEESRYRVRRFPMSLGENTAHDGTEGTG